MNSALLRFGLVVALGCSEAPSAHPPAPQACELDGLQPVVKQIEAEDAVTVARKADGSLWCWGVDSGGICGGDWVPSATKMNINCATTLDLKGMAAATNGRAKVAIWGVGAQDIADEVPYEQNVESAGAIVQVEAGASFLSVLNDEGVVWARGAVPLQGFPLEFVEYAQLQAVPLPSKVRHLAGRHALCGILDTGEVYCQGHNAYGALGHPGLPFFREFELLELPGPVVDVALQIQTSCALLEDGGVYCSGSNSGGQLGIDKNVEERRSFEQVEGLPAIDRLKINSAGATVCGLNGSELWCWGRNSFHPFSDDDQQILPPTKVEPFGDVADFAIGDRHLCVLRSDGVVWCRGDSEANGRCDTSEEWGEMTFEYCDGYAYE